MTWSTFALLSARKTEFAFNIGQFVIILAFHSLLATFQACISLIFDLFLSLFWLKQIQGSVTVKIKDYVQAWSEFLFVSLLVIFNFFPQINHFYYFTSLNGLQDVQNHYAHLRDIDWLGNSISSLSPCIILYIIGLESMKLQNQKNLFASNP